jgi:flagellin-like protein
MFSKFFLKSKKTKNAKKGVSPFIAAVLLIAITVMVSTLMASWFKNYATDTAESSAGTNSINCLNVGLNVKNPTYNSSLNITNFILENTGTVNIIVDRIGINYFYNNGSSGRENIDLSDIELYVGDSYPISIPSVENEFEQIRIILSNCPDKSISLDYSEFNVGS